MITEPPGPEEVLKDISSLLAVAFAGLDAGSQEAKEFFESRHRPLDATLAASILRWRAKYFLDESGHETEFEREDLANNGLCVVYKGYKIRIRKSANGTAPVPGASKVLQDFYSQAQLSFDFDGSSAAQDQEAALLNLLLLWSVTSDYMLKDLTLACPKHGELTRESVELYWEVPIPHPALSVEGPSQADHQTDDLDNIKLDEPEEDTGTNPAL